ncbi:MAG: putative amidohydrolase [Cyclobacteriaceae bacterium]|jgi:omega-amidase
MRTGQLRVTIVQEDLYWENIEANLAHLEEKIWSHEESSDLIVLPEMFTTGFSMNPASLAEPRNSKTFRWMKQQAEQHKAVVCGSYIINEDAKYYNRFYAVYPNGQFLHYDKRHLFTLAGESCYEAGIERKFFVVKGFNIMPNICYDLRFPVWSRQQLTHEYDLLLYVANWPAPRIAAWDTLLKARAIENLSYAAGVNRVGRDGAEKMYVGHSNAYDYLGQPFLDLQEEAFINTVTFDLQKLDQFRADFPFHQEADQFEMP